MVGKSDFKENPKSNLDLDLGLLRVMIVMSNLRIENFAIIIRPFAQDQSQFSYSTLAANKTEEKSIRSLEKVLSS